MPAPQSDALTAESLPVPTRTSGTPAAVIRRDGDAALFDAEKIRSAIERAGAATGEFGADEAGLLTSQAVKVLGHRFAENDPDIEQIQDVVEQVLISANHFATARAYIVYREQRARLRSDKKTVVEVETSMNEYLQQADWRVNANANQGYSLGGLILNVSGKVVANYWLSHVYPAEVGAAHREGDVHIHDLDMLAGYCAGWSLRTLITEGLNGVPGKVESAPPKHLSSAVGQIVNFLGTLQNEWAGAQAFSSFDTYMAPFIRLDDLSYDQVLQSIQELVYNLNVPSRWGTQTPFTNLTFDWTCPEDLAEQRPVIGGVECDFTYSELQREMDMINRAYIEVMTAGDAKGRVFTFPIPTYNITPGVPVGVRERRPALRDDGQVRSAVLPELPQLRAQAQHGALDVLPPAARPDRAAQARQRPLRIRRADRVARRRDDQLRAPRLHARGRRGGPLAQLDTLLDLSRTSLEIKRKVIQRHIDDGLFPYTRRYLGTLRNHFSTIGVNGINEMIRNFTRDEHDITTPEGHAMAVRFLDHVRARIVELPGGDRPPLQPRGHACRGDHVPLRPRGPQALPRHPAGGRRRASLLHQLEPAARRLHHRPVRGALPAGGAAAQVHGRHRAAPLHGRAGLLGGGVQEARETLAGELPAALHNHHAHVLDLPHPRVPRWRAPVLPQVRRDRACRQAQRSQLTAADDRSHTMSNTETTTEHHRARRELADSERQPCEVWTRVMGYHRPVASFNTGKKGEFAEREYFTETDASCS